MVQVMYNTAEELCVLAWTAVLFWLPKCRWFPVICDIMTDLRVIWTFAALVLVLMVASQALPHTRYGRAVHRKSLPPNTPLGVRFTHALRQMTVLEGIRAVLCTTLPMLGVMVVMHPASVAAMCVLKKFALLEGRLWNKWCPEAYIIFISISCIIFIANRSLFTKKFDRHNRFKRESHAHFYNPSPRYNYGMA